MQVAHAGSLAAVSPLGASVGISVGITGTGFDPAPANNRVTFLSPLGAVSATAATVGAPDAAGLRRLTLIVPPGVGVGTTALSVTNTVTGEVSQGKSIEIIAISLPGTAVAAPGATGVQVRIEGSANTKFVAGTTRAAFSGTGITVSSTNVESATSLVATINIASNAATTARDVGIITNQQSAVLPAAFLVGTATPTLIANVQVTGYNGIYDGTPHGATGTATGVNGENLNALLRFNQTFTNVPGGSVHWTFDGNASYKPTSGDVAVTIAPADAVIQVNGFSGIFDGSPHGATGSATGVLGESLSSLLHLGRCLPIRQAALLMDVRR